MITYYVWKRSDGYVSCSCFMPSTLSGRDGVIRTFELLGEFEHWDDAYDMLKKFSNHE